MVRTDWTPRGAHRGAAEVPAVEAAVPGYKCPRCARTFEHGNQLMYHYQHEHAVHDPAITTYLSHLCEICGANFHTESRLRGHVCRGMCEGPMYPAAPRGQLDTQGWRPLEQGPPLPPPDAWHIYTDGSLDETIDQAGWGVAVFREGDTDGAPVC